VYKPLSHDKYDETSNHNHHQDGNWEDDGTYYNHSYVPVSHLNNNHDRNATTAVPVYKKATKLVALSQRSGNNNEPFQDIIPEEENEQATETLPLNKEGEERETEDKKGTKRGRRQKTKKKR